MVESTHSQPHHHLHAVTSGTERLTIKRMQESWRLGFTRITTYDDDDAIRYLTKTLNDSHDGWDLSRRLPPKTTP